MAQLVLSSIPCTNDVENIIVSLEVYFSVRNVTSAGELGCSSHTWMPSFLELVMLMSLLSYTCDLSLLGHRLCPEDSCSEIVLSTVQCSDRVEFHKCLFKVKGWRVFSKGPCYFQKDLSVSVYLYLYLPIHVFLLMAQENQNKKQS